MELIDGVMMNRLHPNTFEIPSEQERNTLDIGKFAKIGLEIPGGQGERFWVNVISEEVTEFGTKIYTGRIDNQLVFVDEYKFGDLIKFEPKHILDILPPV